MQAITNSTEPETSRHIRKNEQNKLRGRYSANELYRPNDHRLSAKLVPTFAVRECCVVSTADPYYRILGFLDQSRYFFF
jgi:hypothetical protein